MDVATPMMLAAEGAVESAGPDPSPPVASEPASVPDLAIEIECGAPDILVCGVDEAGRGPLAGPVTAAAVILPPVGLPADLVAAIDDSKVVKPERRPELAAEIRTRCTVAVASASVEEIDQLNILHATFLAMCRAVALLHPLPALALVDGNQTPKDIGCEVRCVVGGDGLSLSIAAASILAKVARDDEMRRLAEAFPGYGWETNFGYATPAHNRGLAQLGPTIHHRRSFAPIAQLSLGLEVAAAEGDRNA